MPEQQQAPPLQEKRQRRHSTATMVLARGYYETGWTPTQIQRLLEREHGVKVGVSTIRYWVIPGEHEDRLKKGRGYHKRRQAARRRALRAGNVPDPLRLRSQDPEDIAAFVRELDAAGLSKPLIVRVLKIVSESPWSAEQVFGLLFRGEMPC